MNRRRTGARALAFPKAWLVVLGSVVLVTILDGGRLGPNLLLSAVFLAGLAVGAIFFMAAQITTGAKWDVGLWPLPVALSSLLPLALLPFLLLLWLRPETYPWWTQEQPGPRKLWLTHDFFILRSIGYVALWSVAALFLRCRRATQGSAAVVLLMIAATAWLASGDWLMTLTPGWASTLFGGYVLAGFISGALAAILLGCVIARLRGEPGLRVGDTQLHDLATLLFGASCVWMYFWYSQYMLVWYTNQPHEAIYYLLRTDTAWRVPFWGTVALKWAVPFLLLLTRPAKSSPSMLGLAAVSVLAGQWLDLYVMIFPGSSPEDAPFGLLEISAALVTVGTGVRVVSNRLGQPAAR